MCDAENECRRVEQLKRKMRSDARLISGLSQLLREQNVNPSSADVWRAADRFDQQQGITDDSSS